MNDIYIYIHMHKYITYRERLSKLEAASRAAVETSECTAGSILMMAHLVMFWSNGIYIYIDLTNTYNRLYFFMNVDAVHIYIYITLDPYNYIKLYTVELYRI